MNLVQRMTKNKTTDHFGLRQVGFNGWSPQVGYSPLHLGNDSSAGPRKDIRAPFDCQAYADVSGNDYIGGYIMFYNPYNLKRAYYCFHVLPGVGDYMQEKIWVLVRKGQKLGEIDTEGEHHTLTPHLDIRVCTAEHLHEEEMGKPVSENDVVNWANAGGVDINKTIERVNEIRQRWGITAFFENAIVRNQMNPEQQSKHLPEIYADRHHPITWLDPIKVEV